MKSTDQLKYTGNGRNEKSTQKRHPEAPQKPEAYVPALDLVTSVQLAMYLNRPLLLEGEPGCGKTRLAYAIADELGIPIEAWSITSASKVKDGLYEYDSILRLHDVQISKDQPEALKGTGRDPSSPKKYTNMGAIGRAFERKDTPTVILIDEIDKADVDFANDLLTILDKTTMGFTVKEDNNRSVVPKEGYEPIFVITSNREKGNLPDPFLRRCVYHFVKFPGAEDLERIVDRHYEIEKEKSPTKTKEAISKFMPLRKGLMKPPGTSELLDWLHVLSRFGNKDGFAKLESGELPYLPVLIKIAADIDKAKDILQKAAVQA